MGDEEERPIKFGRLEKRSQNRSFFKANNYMTRLFVLKRRYLKYFEGSGNSKVLKRTIDLRTALVIEPVVDGALDGGFLDHSFFPTATPYNPTRRFLDTLKSNGHSLKSNKTLWGFPCSEQGAS